jgi:hypothetical protein
MSSSQLDDPTVNFKTSKVARLPVVRLWDEPAPDGWEPIGQAADRIVQRLARVR